MLIWGSGGKQVDLGVLEQRECGTCEKSRPFKLTLIYKYFHLYWIFKCVTEKKYWLMCEICSRGWELDRKKVEENLTKSPIPISDRYGLAVFGLLIAAIIVFSALTKSA